VNHPIQGIQCCVCVSLSEARVQAPFQFIEAEFCVADGFLNCVVANCMWQG
jgi:hypothetical protein